MTSIRHRISKLGITGKLAFSLQSAVIGSAFQFGYNTGVINAPSKFIRNFINETNVNRYNESMDAAKIEIIWAFTVAIFAIGGCIGGVTNGLFADRLGRKKALLYNNLLAIVAALFMGLSKLAGSYEMIIIGRFIIGLNCGLNSGLCPMYITEIAPVAIRGSVGTLFQLGAVFSIFFSQIFGLPEFFGTEALWPVLLGITGVFAIYQLITLPFCPESQRFLLIQKDQVEAARQALTQLRNNKDVSEEIDAIIAEANLEKTLPKFNILQLFTTRSLLIPTLISIVLHLSQQLSGINAIFFYSTDILIDSGVDNAEYVTPFVGLILVITTIISIPLMEIAGRRFLHLFGLSGMFVFSIVMTVAMVLKSQYDWMKYINVVGMMVYIFFFAIGPGSIPWMVVGEFFTQAPRSAAISLAVLVNWSANVAVGQGFPPLFKYATKEWTFTIFSVLLLFFCTFVYMFMPETKGKTSEEMALYFQNNVLAFRSQKIENSDNNSRVSFDKNNEEIKEANWFPNTKETNDDYSTNFYKD